MRGVTDVQKDKINRVDRVEDKGWNEDADEMRYKVER